MIEATDIEAIAEIAARAVLRVLAEQAEASPKPEPLGWQSAEMAARAIGMSRWTLNNRKDLLRFNQDYRLMPGARTRYQYHVENCQKKLKRN